MMGMARASTKAPKTAPTREADQHRAEGASCFALFCHGMAVEDGGGCRCLTGHTEQDGRDVSGGAQHRGHAEEDGKGLHGRHLDDEREHEGDGGRATEAGQDPHDEADGDAYQHEQERPPDEDLGEPGDEGMQQLNH